MLNLFSANSSFLLTALPTLEKATDTRAAPASVLAHPSSNSIAPPHHLLLGVLNKHQSPVDGTTYPEITHLNGQHEKRSAQDSFHMECQELHLESDLQPKLGFLYNCDKVMCLSSAWVPSIQTAHNKNPYKRDCWMELMQSFFSFSLPPSSSVATYFSPCPSYHHLHWDTVTKKAVEAIFKPRPLKGMESGFWLFGVFFFNLWEVPINST